jgi:glutamate-1-semialdehyde 2,1-aminomutase
MSHRPDGCRKPGHQPATGLAILGSMSATHLAAVPYAELNPLTRQLWERAGVTMPGHGQCHRRPYKYLLRGGPGFVTRAQGARFWDADGREFLDFKASYGPIVLGHGDAEVAAAIAAQASTGVLHALEHPRMLDFNAELCRLIPCAEMVVNTLGGSAATHAAVRIARRHTGRAIILRGGYHGWFDWCLPTDPGVPAVMPGLAPAFAYGDAAALAAALDQHRGQVAAVIMEPVMGDGPQPGYLTAVRQLCDQHGALLILDEIKTGFRFALGGAQERFGIDCDLATFGKAMGNGLPGSAVVGRKEVMGCARELWLAATGHGDLLSMVAAEVVIRRLRAGGIEHLWRLGRRFQAGLEAVFARHGCPLRIDGHPPMPLLTECGAGHGRAPTAAQKGTIITAFCAAMQRRGVYITGAESFIMLAHTDADIDQLIATAEAACPEALHFLDDVAAGRVEDLPYDAAGPVRAG